MVKLLRLAFSGWNTRQDVPPHPNEPSPRTADESRIHVGVWKEDLPESKEKAARRKKDEKAKIFRQPYEAGAERKLGAPAYMRPILHLDDDNGVYHVVDGAGKIVNPQYLLLDPKFPDQATAKADAAVHYDLYEIDRIIRPCIWLCIWPCIWQPYWQPY